MFRMEIKLDMKEMEVNIQRHFTRLYFHLWASASVAMTLTAVMMAAIVIFFA